MKPKLAGGSSKERLYLPKKLSIAALSASGLKRIAPSLNSESLGTAKNIASITSQSESSRSQDFLAFSGEELLKLLEFIEGST